MAYSISKVGGNLIEILAVVSGLKTLPAVAVAGKPSAPTMHKVDFHVLLI